MSSSERDRYCSLHNDLYESTCLECAKKRWKSTTLPSITQIDPPIPAEVPSRSPEPIASTSREEPRFAEPIPSTSRQTSEWIDPIPPEPILPTAEELIEQAVANDPLILEKDFIETRDPRHHGWGQKKKTHLWQDHLTPYLKKGFKTLESDVLGVGRPDNKRCYKDKWQYIPYHEKTKTDLYYVIRVNKHDFNDVLALAKHLFFHKKLTGVTRLGFKPISKEPDLVSLIQLLFYQKLGVKIR